MLFQAVTHDLRHDDLNFCGSEEAVITSIHYVQHVSNRNQVLGNIDPNRIFNDLSFNSG
jgi:hypothetical protein